MSFGSKSTVFLMFVHAYQNHGIEKHKITSDCYSTCTASTKVPRSQYGFAKKSLDAIAFSRLKNQFQSTDFCDRSICWYLYVDQSLYDNIYCKIDIFFVTSIYVTWGAVCYLFEDLPYK